MHTSGKGGRDHLMTVVPLVMLVVFVMFMAGGPSSSLAWLEEILRGFVNWATALIT